VARVLLVEDDSTVVELMRDVLGAMGGHEVAHAADGVYALQFMGVTPPESVRLEAGVTDWTFTKNSWSAASDQVVLPDLVVTDCMMPRLDGYTLVRQMAQEDAVRSIPVIVLTTKAKMEEPFLQLSNVAGFVPKPADPDRLLELVAKALAAKG
jgi:CheY-like chemotaxis protein